MITARLFSRHIQGNLIWGSNNMPREKKQRLKQRKDGRYCCKYHGIQFMAASSDEALALREEYKEREKAGLLREANGPTVGEYAIKWLPRVKVDVSDQTYGESAALLEKLTSRIGVLYFPDVKPSDVKNIYSSAFNGYSESYIRSAKQLYIGLFDAAVADGYCVRNPAQEKAAQPHKGTKGGHRAITDQERIWINTLCVNHRCRPAVMAMLYEGLRPPEAKALNIDKAIDRENKKVHVIDFVHKDGYSHYKITGEGKTPKSVREIPLFSPFAKAIEGKSGMLVPTVQGGDLTTIAWRRAWESYVHQMETEINGMQKRWYKRTKEHKKILAEAAKLRKEGKTTEAKAKEAEIPPWVSFTVRPYDLRHSFAKFCRDGGVEINTCIKWMGHTDANMILKIYDEVSEDRSKKEAEKLEKNMFGMQNGMQKRVFHVKRSKIKAFRT